MMHQAYHAICQIDLVDCPGTGDDEANLKLAGDGPQGWHRNLGPGRRFGAIGRVELSLRAPMEVQLLKLNSPFIAGKLEEGMEPNDFTDRDLSAAIISIIFLK